MASVFAISRVRLLAGFPSSLPFWSRAVRKHCLSTSAPRSAEPVLESAKAAPGPDIVRATKDERRSGKLSERSLERAVRALYHDGIVVIEDAVQCDAIDHLNEKMTLDASILQNRGDDGPFNYNVGNMQQDAPPVREYFTSDVFLNPLATQITSAILGPKPKWTFCSGNSAMPPIPDVRPQRQPVHSDADFSHPDIPFGLVINVPLVDFTPENGSTEVWLGTHIPGLSGLAAQEGEHGNRASGRIKEHLLSTRRFEVPPVQPSIRKGSIVTRIMLAMIHFAPWYRNPMRLQLSESVRPLVESESGLDVPVDWVSEEEAIRSYLNRGFGNSYDFSQAV